ncbi:alpha/beta hydrolase [Spirosoma sp. KCTC 42546]|uniref:alpha/beta hydrolase n=1 Tax=Spirosoma sp. KCTC 42546 TaxID=2520506 RepID=UPI0011570371|nr:alpha/beta hydrolase-fold protein [Spirosoma sp. KCTC 42546]QDK80939.1 alpha/beta hydrolase [Spirosoma sp. KCTC 42546]
MYKVLCLTFSVGFWLLANPSFGQNPPSTKPFVLGLIDAIPSNELGETRALNIYLPDGYSKDSIGKYPVIYLLDGSADEDFIHIAGLVQFANFPWVNLLPKSIVVGIANVDRRRDFTYPTTIEKDKKEYPTTGQSQRFIAFLEKELQPYIQKNYSSNPSRTIIGQSLGGLLATEILFKKPSLFNQYIIVSPSLWWDNESLLAYPPVFAKPDFQQKTTVFVGVGKEGKIMETDANQLVYLLKKYSTKPLEVGFHYFGDENHATIFHLAVYKAFERFKK